MKIATKSLSEGVEGGTAAATFDAVVVRTVRGQRQVSGTGEVGMNL
ncbi:hypothetical protein ABIB57_005344 [Devosia sp. UYZn731]